MPSDLGFLDSRSKLHQDHDEAWARDEARLVGGDAILDELIRFAHEADDSYSARRKWARWTNFGRGHTTLLSGHITRVTPVPNYAELGPVRQRKEIGGQPSLAELFHYNCDGVGSDGSQLPAYMTGVEQRALATEFRWLMMEMPSRRTLEAIRLRLGKTPTATGLVTEEEVRAGFRPILVERSPRQVTNHRVIDGVLVWAICRIPVDAEMDFEQSTPTAGRLGYYLLVRKGYLGLGSDFEGGGWWKYDAEKRLIDQGTWDDTDGDIPMWMHIGEPGIGTTDRPSIGTSSTMELGQISADLMNAVSEQRFNLRQAAKSMNHYMGIDKEALEAVHTQQRGGTISVGVPFAKAPDGTWHVPTMWNSSAAALDGSAYATVIAAAISEAKEIMVRQVTSSPDASGVKVEASFGEATSPMLARIADTAEQSYNTLLYFLLKRSGIKNPTASVQIPREFPLREILSSIDQMLETLGKAGLSSVTWLRSLVARKGDELGLLPEKERKQIEAELAEGSDATLNRSKLQAEVVKAWLDAGASEAGAAQEAGVSEERVAVIFGTPNPTTEEPDIAPVPGQAA